jgi:IclR family KDG regulon transcriptional repressor
MPSPSDARLSPRIRPRRKKKSEYLIQSVANALDVLEALAQSPEETGVTDLSRQLHLHKNNVFRLLATLQTRGYVEQNPDSENYRLGLASLSLGRGFLQQTRLLRHAREALEEIASRLGETAHVAVARAEEVVTIDGVEPERTLRVVARPGMARPFHATAEGKVLAAFDTAGASTDPAAWEGRALRRHTGATCTDPHRLAEEMKEIAARGWAADRGEFEDGIAGVAAPVRDHAGRVVAALSVSLPRNRLNSPAGEEQLAIFMREAADRLSRRLGFRDPAEDA